MPRGKNGAELNKKVGRWSEHIGELKQVTLQNNVLRMIPFKEYTCASLLVLPKNV